MDHYTVIAVPMWVVDLFLIHLCSYVDNMIKAFNTRQKFQVVGYKVSKNAHRENTCYMIRHLYMPILDPFHYW